jgi:aldose 1-epimerase
MQVTSAPTVTAEGDTVTVFCCRNDGMQLRVMTYGATVMSLAVPDRAGTPTDVVLGCRSVDAYLGTNTPFFGGTIGRCCNRIRHGRFAVDGAQHQLTLNDGGRNHLHGGVRGFDRVHWAAEAIEHADAVGVRLTYTSAAGEEGYPGTLHVTAEYTITLGNEFCAEFRATTDAATPVNVTNHCYWNLAGAAATTGGAVLKHHVLQLSAASYVAVDDERIPTGCIVAAADTPFDFVGPRNIGDAVAGLAGSVDALGFDHCFMLPLNDTAVDAPAATLSAPSTGITMTVRTTQPALQLYTGNYLGAEDAACGGHGRHSGVCLEAQHPPDAPNRPEFPSVLLRPGERYRHRTTHSFTVT